MSHARAAIAGVLAAGLIVIIATRAPEGELSDTEAKIIMLMFGLMLILILPEALDLLLRRKRDKEDDE
jgi:hypothetical protein